MKFNLFLSLVFTLFAAMAFITVLTGLTSSEVKAKVIDRSGDAQLLVEDTISKKQYTADIPCGYRSCTMLSSRYSIGQSITTTTTTTYGSSMVGSKSINAIQMPALLFVTFTLFAFFQARRVYLSVRKTKRR